MKKPKYNFYTCPPDKCISVKLVEGSKSVKKKDLGFTPEFVISSIGGKITFKKGNIRKIKPKIEKNSIQDLSALNKKDKE